MKKQYLTALSIFLGLLIIGCVAYKTYVVDRVSLEEVDERVGYEFDPPYDYPYSDDDWAEYGYGDMPEDAFYTRLPIDREQSLPLTLENLSSGKIALQYDVYDPLKEEMVNHSIFIFKDGVTSECFASSNEDIEHGCAGYEQMSFTLKDLIPLSGKRWTNTQHALVLLERKNAHHDDTVVLLISGCGSVDDRYTYYKNLCRVSQEKVVFEGIDPNVSWRYNTSIIGSAGEYDSVSVFNNGAWTDYVFETLYVRNGPELNVYTGSEGIVQIDRPVGTWDYNSSDEIFMGAVTFKFPLSNFFLSPSYGYYGGGYQIPDDAGNRQQIYFRDMCEVPYTFSDFSQIIDTEYVTDAEFDISIPLSDTYNLTTSYYGYNPEEWGKITAVVSVDAYLRDVQNGVSFGGHPTELLWIEDVPVRHTLPYLPARPCDSGRVYEQYQWVRGNNLFSVTLSAKQDEFLEKYTTEESEKNVLDMLEILVKNTTYAPSPVQ